MKIPFPSFSLFHNFHIAKRSTTAVLICGMRYIPRHEQNRNPHFINQLLRNFLLCSCFSVSKSEDEWRRRRKMTRWHNKSGRRRRRRRETKVIFYATPGTSTVHQFLKNLIWSGRIDFNLPLHEASVDITPPTPSTTKNFRLWNEKKIQSAFLWKAQTEIRRKKLIPVSRIFLLSAYFFFHLAM